jgi:signal peptide peptidase SppA
LLFRENKPMTNLSRIIAYVRENRWAIQPRYLAIMRDLIEFRASGGKLTKEEVQEQIGPTKEDTAELYAAQERAELQGAGAVQVIPVFGIIAHHAYMVDDISGPRGTATETVSKKFKEALENHSVSAIVLNVHSPGGSVDGVEELAAEIRAARGQKRIVAVANAMAASAAYYIAAAADELVVTPSGEVGSIGVLSAHEDLSEALKMEGVKITLIHAGKYKVESNPFEPLTDEAREQIQKEVDVYYNAFVGSVAKGRGVSVATVRKDFGQGRMVTAKEAVSLGMADRVGTLEDTIARLLKAKPSSGRRAEDEGDEFTTRLDNTKDGTISITFDNIAETYTVNHWAQEEEESVEPAETKEEKAEEETAAETVEEVEESVESSSEDEDELYEWQTKIERWKQNALDNQES